MGACRRAQGRYRRKENGFNANDLCHYEVSKWEIVLCGDFWKTLDTVKKGNPAGDKKVLHICSP